jgi:type VI secretion system protein VasG
MAAVDLSALITRLAPLSKQTLESAIGLTMSRTHFNAELEHWLVRLLEAPDSDVNVLVKHYDLDRERLLSDLNRVLDKLKTGNSRPPALSPNLVKLMREAWTMASVQYGEGHIRTGHLIVALLADETLAPLAREASRQFDLIAPDTLRKEFAQITATSTEAASAAPVAAPGAPQGAATRPGASGKTPNLDQFTIDITEEARAGKIDPILGRDTEVRQIIDILTRRRQNNPILTGEAGVGKTAVVEGFALRIVQGDVPDMLKNVAVKSLDMTLLQAGAGMKGEFENRLKNVIKEVESSATPIILFIDEAHSLVGAGGAAGQGDAANILKPALARGQLRTIAATTWAEYKKYFERDPALTRRFQVVKVEEPSEAVAIDMMRGLAPVLEKHHRVRLLTEAVAAAVRLSSRYIPARQLPDKAVSLLDTACARVSMSRATTPEPIELRQRRLDTLAAEMKVLQREAATGVDHAARMAELDAERDKTTAELAALESQLASERALIERIDALLDQLEAPAEGADSTALQADLKAAEAELAALQGDAPLLKGRVDAQAVADVVANWTGIPVGRMAANEIKTVLSLKERMEERVIGQPQALEAITETIWTARAKLSDPRKPIGVFMMVGTSGVGKTETALALAELMYGGEQNMTVINMSEFKEEHKVSMLVGSPPGYVGFGEGGVLTEAVRRRPYSVILLDEMEKAHPGVQDVFYQVFDKGMLRDGEGRDIDFKNTIIIMTSNAGTDLIHSLCADPETMPDAAGLAEALRPELLKLFKPAFLGRTTMVPYFPLAPDIIRKIIALQMRRIEKRLSDNYKASFTYAPEVLEAIAERCTEVQSGARNIEQVITHGLLPDLSAEILQRISLGEDLHKVHLSLNSEGQFKYELQ